MAYLERKSVMTCAESESKVAATIADEHDDGVEEACFGMYQCRNCAKRMG